MLDQGLQNLSIGYVVQFLFWQVDQFILNHIHDFNTLNQRPNDFIENHIFVVDNLPTFNLFFPSFYYLFRILCELRVRPSLYSFISDLGSTVRFASARFRLITLLRWRFAVYRFGKFHLSILFHLLDYWVLHCNQDSK